MADERESQSSTSSSDPSSSQDSVNDQSQVAITGDLKSQNANVRNLPMMHPTIVPGLFPPRQDGEHMNHGPGLYAVQVHPFMQPITGFPSNTLIPFTYNIPTERIPETREVAGEQGQVVEHQQQQARPPRQVVRRFQIAIHIDIFLILKLAAVIFLFNQDGSKQRLTLLVIFASVVYLYQTGALAPLVRWLSQGMQRAAARPQPPRAAVRVDNIPPAGRGQGNENADLAAPAAGENENEPGGEGNVAIENENEPELGQGGNRLWGIVKEIQMFVFGFITSLLPGFHHID